ncbi:MAG: hypothetical protein ACLVCH_10330 [Roseburia inulinivorans]
MENVTFDYKFYRIPKRFFKEDTFRDMTNAQEKYYMEYCWIASASVRRQWGCMA